MPELAALLQTFETLSLAEYFAIEGDDVRKATALIKRRLVVMGKMRRPVDQRRALLPLLNHPNIRVRLNAAFELLALEPEKAWATMAEIRASHHTPFSADAGLAFINVARGIFVPD